MTANGDSLIAVNLPKAPCLLNSISIQKNQSSLEKRLIPGLGQVKYKISLEHLVESQGEKVQNWTRDRASEPN